jgi:hypothetical protein
VIAVDHESIDRDGATRGLTSLAEQTCQDFEVVLVHDGPASAAWSAWVATLPLRPITLETGYRLQTYGHWSRDLGMRAAHGEWFVHHNIDNVWRPWAFERIAQAIDENPAADAMVFPIMHHKLGCVLSGRPVQVNNIDAMQMVAKRDVWHEINYWHNHVHDSDGRLYEEIAGLVPVHFLDGEAFGDNF